MKLDIKKLKKNKCSKIILSKEALKDIERFNWNDEVLNGSKKVIVK